MRFIADQGFDRNAQVEQAIPIGVVVYDSGEFRGETETGVV